MENIRVWEKQIPLFAEVIDSHFIVSWRQPVSGMKATYSEKQSWETGNNKASSKNIFFFLLILDTAEFAPHQFFFLLKPFEFSFCIVLRKSLAQVHICTCSYSYFSYHAMNQHPQMFYKYNVFHPHWYDFIQVSNDLLSAKPWSVFSLFPSQKNLSHSLRSNSMSMPFFLWNLS